MYGSLIQYEVIGQINLHIVFNIPKINFEFRLLSGIYWFYIFLNTTESNSYF